jgi:hypothetical protein
MHGRNAPWCELQIVHILAAVGISFPQLTHNTGCRNERQIGQMSESLDTELPHAAQLFSSGDSEVFEVTPLLLP